MGELRGLEGSKALLFRNCPPPPPPTPLFPLLRGPGCPNWPLLVVGAAMKGLGKELFCPDPGKGKGLESWKGEGVRFGCGVVTNSCEA